MESFGIPVCYYDENNSWHNFYRFVESIFPLDKVKTSIPDIDEPVLCDLNIQFFHVSDKIWDDQEHLINTYKKPYMYIYLLSFEDFELFRSEMKTKLQAFIDTVSKRAEWLVIYFPSIQIANETSLKNYKKTFEKVKLEFADNTDFQERFQKFLIYNSKVGDVIPKEEGVEEFSKFFKEKIGKSLSKRKEDIETEIYAIYGLKENPGWDYLQYFVVKENLALILEMMNLIGDAMQKYEELRNLYYEWINIGNFKINFRNSKLEEDYDNYNPILINYSKKPFRMMIYNNSITEFQFVQYLFARKFYLLKKLDMDLEATDRIRIFIRNICFVMNKKSGSDHIPLKQDIFRYIWLYQVANGFVEIFGSANQGKLTFQKKLSLSLNIADLRQLLKFYIKKLGHIFYSLSHKHLEINSLDLELDRYRETLKRELEKTSPSQSEETEKEDKSSEIIKDVLKNLKILHDRDLLDALHDKNRFFDILYKVCTQLIVTYDHHSFKKLAASNKIELLKICLSFKMYNRVEVPETFESLSMEFTETWVDINTALYLSVSLAYYFKMNYEKFILSTLHLLKSDKISSGYKKEIMGFLEKFSWEPKLCLKCDENDISHFSLENFSLTTNNNDLELNVSIFNNLNYEISFKEICFKLQVSREISDKGDDNAMEEKVITVTKQGVTLRPGVNDAKFKSETEFSATFRLKSAALKMGNIKFEIFCASDFRKSLTPMKSHRNSCQISLNDFLNPTQDKNFQIYMETPSRIVFRAEEFNFNFHLFQLSIAFSDSYTVKEKSTLIYKNFKDEVSKCEIQSHLDEGSIIFEWATLPKDSDFIAKNLIAIKSLIIIVEVQYKYQVYDYEENLKTNLKFFHINENKEANDLFEEAINNNVNLTKLFKFRLEKKTLADKQLFRFFLRNKSKDLVNIEKLILKGKMLSDELVRLEPNEKINYLCDELSKEESESICNFKIDYRHIQEEKLDKKKEIYDGYFSELLNIKKMENVFRIPNSLFDDVFQLRVVLFEVSIDFQAEATLGVPFRIKFLIKRKGEDKAVYWASFENLENNWIVVGERKKQIDLTEVNECEIDAQVIPISTGMHKSPEIIFYREKGKDSKGLKIYEEIEKESVYFSYIKANAIFVHNSIIVLGQDSVYI